MNGLSERVKELSEQDVFLCYQCGSCSAGCLFTDDMDMLPHQVIHLVQNGDKEVLKKETPWICASCFTCSVRCPRSLDVAAIMEAIREINIRRRDYDKADLKGKIRDRSLPQIAITAFAQKFTW